ncbi:hypothetical protein CJ030_MR0G026025 [Morella rubra]|uniref:Uncharacterized protein n=1 Tax=Morella rubra TaxID=262757 RepID=A0A6A1UH81_9ROSI|nr:hypothetical protein CJ030_MR0G026025 [Morella rubra]
MARGKDFGRRFTDNSQNVGLLKNPSSLETLKFRHAFVTLISEVVSGFVLRMILDLQRDCRSIQALPVELSDAEINIMDHRPSVIAAATILVGIYDQLTVEDLELKMSTIPFSGSLKNEHIFSCFNLMQNIKELKAKSVQNSAKKRKLKTHWPVAENFCTVHCLVGVIKNSSSPLAVRLKRRLPFITNHNCRRLPFAHHGDLTSASTFP